MKRDLPSIEIINDLLTENWALRWQALEIFSQVQLSVRNHARTSKEYQGVHRLGQQLARTLNGANDRNLHLVITAAYFLGGNNFIFHIFHHLGLDDSDEFYPEISKIKRELGSESGQLSFYDYFMALLRAQAAVESTTAIAATLTINLFSAAIALQMILTIPNPEQRSLNLELLRRAHPQHHFNNLIFTDNFSRLKKHPELIHLIEPPLNRDQTCICNTVISAQLSQTNTMTPIMAATIGRLQLQECLPRLDGFADKNLAITIAKARLGDQASQNLLLSASSSWRRKKRLAALSGLSFIENSAAIDKLQQRAIQGDLHERRIALTALAGNPQPEALEFLTLTLKESQTNPERSFLLNLLKNHPQVRPNAATANFIVQWHDQGELYPELLEALAVFGYGDQWIEILDSYKPPLQPQQQKIALFMARFAERPAIGKTLLGFLDDRDWDFSFQLLTVLQDFFTGNEFRLLLNLLEKFATKRELTISEKLIQGADTPEFDTALTDFLDNNQELAANLINTFTTELMEGSLPSNKKLRTDFAEQPEPIQKLCLGTNDNAATRPRASRPLLHILRLLNNTSFAGGNALAAVINRTRQDHGYLRHLISDILISIIENDTKFQNANPINDLKQALDFIRQRPNYDELRSTILQRIAAISRHAKDLKIDSDGSRNRCLRVLSVKHIKSVKTACGSR